MTNAAYTKLFFVRTYVMSDTHSLFATDIGSVTAESMPHFPHAVDAVNIPMDSTNAFDQHSITTAAST